MHNPFAKKKQSLESSAPDHQALENLSIKDLGKRTAAIEAEREQKRLAREEKKFHQEQNQKRRKIERWIAPLLLILTTLISFFLYWQNS